MRDEWNLLPSKHGTDGPAPFFGSKVSYISIASLSPFLSLGWSQNGAPRPAVHSIPLNYLLPVQSCSPLLQADSLSQKRRRWG
jgi:hypothetical protein